MKRNLITVLIALLLPLSAFSQEKNKPLSFDLNADFAYHPQTDFIKGGDHFAPVTGFYEGLELRVIGNMNYVIPTPLGESWLLSDANVKLQANFELSPVSIKPGFHVEFTPLPFLVFSAGAQIGTGWEAFGTIGAGKYNGIDKNDAYRPFEACFLKWYVQGTFQFDAEALWPGEWHHIQLMYSYQAYYEGLTNVSDGDLWVWQGAANKANGICNYQNLILAYQMPLVLSRAGVMFELNGHYSANDYKNNPGFKGDFMEFAINPLLQFTFTEKDLLTVMATFKTRRSFEEAHSKDVEEPHLNYSGYEWHLNRIVLSYQHKF